VLPPEVWERVRKASRLVVVADGPLNLIPLEALVVRAPAEGAKDVLAEARFVLDDAPPMTYVPSGTVYLNRRKARDAQIARGAGEPPSALVVGDPLFEHGTTKPSTPEQDLLTTLRGPEGQKAFNEALDRSRAEISATDQVRLYGGKLPPLPWTRREAQAVSRALAAAGGQAVTLLGAEGSSRKVRDAVVGRRFVHLATHGLTGTADRPYDASLALARPVQPTPEDNGFLTLDDLIRGWRGRLAECELVVLSACETQKGVAVGDAQMALPWGFFYAGAPSVVASLWKVDDAATATLMESFYRQMLTPAGARAGKLAALADAKRQLRKSHPHPYHWAPFVYLGDPR
jgi:hypothetical protein